MEGELNREMSERAVIRLSPEPAMDVSSGKVEMEEEKEEEVGGTGGEDTVVRLRCRIEQQSTLIAMLKQRADETLREVRWG